MGVNNKSFVFCIFAKLTISLCTMPVSDYVIEIIDIMKDIKNHNSNLNV